MCRICSQPALNLMKVQLTDAIELPAHVLFREVEEDVVLLDLRSGSYFGLDSVGRRIWQLLHAHRDLRKVHEVLVAEYAAGPEQLENDLLALVEKLADAGLVKVRS